MLQHYDDVLTVQEACEILMVGKNSIYDLIRKKQLEAYRTDNGRIWKIPKDSLIHYIRQSSDLHNSP